MNIVIAKLAKGSKTDRRYHEVAAKCEALAREANLPLRTIVLEDVNAELPSDTDLVVMLIGEDLAERPSGPFCEATKKFEFEGGLVAKADYWDLELGIAFRTYLRYARRATSPVAA